MLICDVNLFLLRASLFLNDNNLEFTSKISQRCLQEMSLSSSSSLLLAANLLWQRPMFVLGAGTGQFRSRDLNTGLSLEHGALNTHVSPLSRSAQHWALNSRAPALVLITLRGARRLSQDLAIKENISPGPWTVRKSLSEHFMYIQLKIHLFLGLSFLVIVDYRDPSVRKLIFKSHFFNILIGRPTGR